MIGKLFVIALNVGVLFGLGKKIYWRLDISFNSGIKNIKFCRHYNIVVSPSKEDTWTCGVWLAANEWQLEPTEAYFVFPKQNRIECPVSAYKERSEVAENCKRLGQNRITDSRK